MFRHQGKSRTFKHNLRIATVLSFVAGMVNVTGFLAIQQLTTNVTGHFALFMNDVTKFEFWKGSIYLLYIVAFLVGSFVSSWLIEYVSKYKNLNVFVLPTVLESAILVLIALLYDLSILESTNVIACLLLFAMGVQNSFVTKISNTIVRTTHLTGLFTDLGIELSQLFFPKQHPYQKKIISTIKLRLYIISFFFIGGVIGGSLYAKIGLNALLFAAIILMAGLIFDHMKFKLIKLRRKHIHRRKILKKPDINISLDPQ